MGKVVSFPHRAAALVPAPGGYGPDVPAMVMFRDRPYQLLHTYETRALIEGPDGAQRIARIAYLTPATAANT